jgi:PAS domain S-box-containing protein
MADINGAAMNLEAVYRQALDQRLRFQQMFDFAPLGCVVTDLYGVIREANHAAAALLGSRKEFLAGKPLAFYLGGEDRSAFYRNLCRLQHDSEQVHAMVACLRPPRGEPRFVELTVGAFTDGDRVGANLCWLLGDVSQAQQVEQQLSAERNFSEVLVDTAEVIILVVDEGGRVVRSNPYLSRLSGWMPAELAGQDWCELLAAEHRPKGRALVRNLLDEEIAERFLCELEDRNGVRHAVAWSVRRLGPEDRALGVLLTGLDVTDLQEAQRMALQSARLATIGQTMAALAHEGRNALQRSHSFLERLAWKLNDRPEELELVARAQKAQDDLARLFRDIQGYAKPVGLDRTLCDLAEVWRDAWREAAGARPNRNVRLHEALRADSLYCYADPFQLGQVFRNIFENALAARPDPVCVEVDCADSVQEDGPALQVVVRDNGPGLNTEQRRRIFEPFYTTKVKGTGLGMAIAKRIVEAHEGRIAVGSGNGSGAEIVITLPRSRP